MPMQPATNGLAQEFLNNGIEIKYKKDEIIIRPEVEIPGVFFIKSGYLKVFELTKSGDENISTFKQPGNIFPMIWAIQGGNRDMYVQTITETVAYRLDRTHFRQYLDAHPQAMRDTLHKMVRLYEAYTDRVHNLEFRYARERIAYRLLSLAERYGSKRNGKHFIKLPIRQSEFADSINVTRETASRELSKLKRKKLIDYTDTHYTILDPAGLEKLY